MKFKIGFEKEDKKTLYSYFDDIIANEQWSWPGSKYEVMFEESFAEYVGTKYAVAFNSWWSAALSVLSFYKITYHCEDDSVILCPSNTFMAVPMAIKEVGFRVKFIDCNKEDLCVSMDHISQINLTNVAGVFLVHIGGHIAFDTKQICSQKNIRKGFDGWDFVIEDCAHAHGADCDGKKAGTFGNAGIYSFHATKTITTGEGGMVVTNDWSLMEFCKKFRDYAKPNYRNLGYYTNGGNYRMSEFTAALGVVQTKRIDDIVNWKREYAERFLDSNYSHVNFPKGMRSGYYKYITFDEIDDSCGKVYDNPCHKIMDTEDYLPNTDWVAKNHWCIPLYYKGEGMEG